MQYEYLYTTLVNAEIDIENDGDCCILARNDFGEEFYLCIKTELGWTEVFEYGPAMPDIELLPANVVMKYQRFEYSEFKISRIIDKFLNDAKRMITQAQEVAIDELIDKIENPLIKMYQKEL